MQKQQAQKQLSALLCQLHPASKQKKQNIARVQKSLQNYTSSSKLDIVIFPEMSFIGYNFQNKEDALPYAVKPGEGEEFQFCISLAKRLKSYVAFGFIEKEQINDTVKLYNSASVIDRQGNIILNYRKTFLYFCDKLWCEEGNGFKSLQITNTKGQKFKCVIGICMDINPKDFTSGEYEFGQFALKQNAQVILFLTNWVDSQAESVQDSAVIAMFEYWAHRMRPMLSASKEEKKNPFLFLAADRVGAEYSYFDKKDTVFFGSSCAIMFNPNYLIQKLGKKEEGYLKIEAKLPK